MQTSTDDISILRKWIGHLHTCEAIINCRQANLMNLLLDCDYQFKVGDSLPPLWHWLYFVYSGKQSNLGYDGHLKLGEFLPPVSLPRRMWASGEFNFIHPIKIGDRVIAHSSIKDVQLKQGRSGKLCFVIVEHHYHVDQLEYLNEHQCIVYRDRAVQQMDAEDFD